ncbi:MAG: ferric reductase-like transmembrane domain-containing protein [Candidatus Moranbacteria bacterium]|nr:ferric reductase-like transmembrane domain-containing protein [Candidatus Moranbacteria bacterium]
MHKPSSLKDYIVAFSIAGGLAIIFSLYLFTRQGYLLDAPASIDTLAMPNKILASVAMTLLAFTLLIGPLTRFFDRFDTWLGYRKEIGIVAGFLAVLHGLVSYYLLPLTFPKEWIEWSTPQFGAGLIGAIILTALFAISFRKAIMALTASRWWFLQRFGLHVAIVATLAHVYIMKWDSWVLWFNESGPSTPETIAPWLPGLAILTTLFITWVVIVRLYESLFLFRSLGVVPKEISMDPLLKARGRRFFLFSLAIFILLKLIILFRCIQ